uniref:Uncharacterized protein n=1 Tax=uncultured marine thaumarchaeote KM3_61_F08 TaxID=1456214 RepID=A0A075HBK7_9ARCH|nr:hypothetical protein [uncultured marine thaumarchaeote KM3_61_F08]
MFLEFIEFLILRPNLLADEKLLRFMKNLPKQKSHKSYSLRIDLDWDKIPSFPANMLYFCILAYVFILAIRQFFIFYGVLLSNQSDKMAKHSINSSFVCFVICSWQCQHTISSQT